MAKRKAISLALSTVMLAASAAVGTGPAAATSDTSGAAGPDTGRVVPATSPAAGEVTLITGDRVRLSSDGVATVVANARPNLRFSTYKHAGRTHVIPSDAASLLAAGVLDERLFDVTALLDAGYDTRRGGLPLIVVPDERGRSALAARGARIKRELPAVRGVAVESSHAAPLWNTLTVQAARGRTLRPGISRVWLDGQRRIALDQSVPQVGAPSAWGAGFTGTGVKVAVVDTGIDSTHPDLTGKVIAAQNFTTESDTLDHNGHGTHVASTVAGTGAASGGLNKGVAPGASLLSAKVCTEGGNCAESAILAGMTWAAQQGADVVNMSIGGRDLSGADPMEQAVNNLTASSGALFVIAAGNNGATAPDYTVDSPGAADAALTVGAVDSGDSLAWFSGRGPRVGDAALKPDITAPGVDITAARSSTSSLPGSSYTDLSGTSMATPHVAGAAAILAQRRPTWTPAQLKAGLMASAAPQASTDVFGQGAGRLRVDREINQTVLANPPSISLGRQVAPHADDPVLTRTVQYQNTGTTSVSLTLTLNALDPSGSPAPTGMFALNTGTVTVPAGGTASVTLTTDTRVDGPEGLYGGWISATGGGGSISVSTPFGVHRADGAEITFHLRNRAGQYSPDSEIMMMPVSPGAPIIHMWLLPAQPITIWVPSGVYLFKAMLPEDANLVGGATVMINARMVVNTSTPTTQNLDAAGGGMIDVTVPNPGAVREVTEVAGQLTEAGYERLAGHAFLGSPGPIYTKQYGTTTASGFVTKIRRQMGVPGPVNVGHNQTTMYNMAWFPTTFPTGWTRNVTAAQLATVNSTHWAHVTGGLGAKGVNAQPGSGTFPAGVIAQSTFDLPFTRTEYYNTESGVRWQAFFTDYLGTSLPYMDSESAPTAFTAGTTTAQTWNKPVYGPALGTMMRPENHVTRNGDIIQLYPPMLSDSEGRIGHLVNGTGTFTLKRGTEVLGTWPYPTYIPSVFALVPPEQHTYTLEATVTRDAPPALLSTQVSAVWTFKSATVPWNQYTRLPLWYVLFKPNINAANSSPAGTTFDIPLTAAAQPTSSPGSLSTVTVQYSTNGGSSWTNATLTGSGANRTARVTHPSGTGYVSLRTTVTDSAGNAVTQTVIRAYSFG